MRFSVLCLALGLLISPVCAEPRPNPDHPFGNSTANSLEELKRIKDPNVRALIAALPGGHSIPRVFIFSHDGQSLVSWGLDLPLTLLQLRNGQVERAKWSDETYSQISTPYPEFECWRWVLKGGAFSPDGRYLALARQYIYGQYPPTFGDEDVALVDMRTLRVVRLLAWPKEVGKKNLFGGQLSIAIAFSSDSKQLVVGGNQGEAVVYSISGEILAQWSHPKYGKLSVAFVPTPSGERAVALAFRRDLSDRDSLVWPSFDNGTPELWDIAKNQQLAAFAQVSAVQAAMFSADGSRVMMVGAVNESFTTPDGKFTDNPKAVPGILTVPLTFNSDSTLRSRKPWAIRLDSPTDNRTFVLTPDEKNLLKFSGSHQPGLDRVTEIPTHTPTP